MLRLMTHNRKRTGFTLIELAIVLAVTSLLTAGLWRMMSSGNTQLRDQAAADQHNDLINAVRGYLASTDGQTRLTGTGANGTFSISLDCAAPDANFCNFRPVGMSATTTNSYGQTYGVQVLKDGQAVNTPPNSYSFMIKTVGGETVPDTSGGRISSMIGADGGFVYNAAICGAAGATACGAFGSWNAAPDAVYGYANTAAGQVASRTFVGLNASLNTPWLARLNVDGDTVFTDGLGDYNTVQTDISLGGNTLYGATATDDIGGSIDGLRHAELLRPAADNAGEASLEITSACKPTTLGDATCLNVVQITGGVGVDGLLQADQLYAGSFIYDTTSSDKRLKHDIAPIRDVLAKFENLHGYSFVMNGQKETKYGVIAQEIEKVFPHVVHERADGTKAVDYIGLIGPLVEAVNALRAENAALRKDMETLRSAHSAP